MVLAPEHELVTKHSETISNWSEVETYINATKSKKEMDRLDDTKEKTGVLLEGITATNPASGEEIPVYIADYVLAGYGTGAIMAVPAHDERDHEFAHKFGIKIQSVIAPQKITHAGALLEVVDKPGTFLFQKRTIDCKTNPGKFALFGGGIEEGETVETALTRELEEELELKVTKLDFKNSYCYPSQNLELYICATHINDVEPSTLTLHEGEAMIEMTLEEACQSDNLADSLRSLIKNPVDVSKIYVQSGILHNSAEFDGMDSKEAKSAIVEKVGGRMTNTYRLRDWSIGRQRYWGVPIPIVYDPEGKAHVVSEEHLPWTLPEDVDFKPTGEPPLAKSVELKKRTEDIFGTGWTPEVETMDTFVDSAWYFLRYIDPTNSEMFASKEQQADWMPIDLYFGGAEHTTMHLLYSRFWQKALHKLGLVTNNEPYKRRVNHGMILGPDGNKMSKSKGNVVDPDEQVKLVGSDTVKMYLAFMGPYQDNSYPWDPGGVVGLRRFLERVNGLNEHVLDGDVDESPDTVRQLHKTIKKVGADIEAFKFNTAISAMMIFINVAEKEGLSDNSYANFLRLLAPFAPHLTEELWREHGMSDSIHLATFPEFDPTLAKDDLVTIGVQINGKMRGKITIEPDADEATVVAAAQNDELLQEKFAGTTTKKVIYVPGRILNFIVTD
jgi:leucyl-tRNA synthetase